MENKMTTKKRIIIESLKLFASKGYDGVSMREIAAAVGIKGASIYNHFKGKEDIFLGIFEEMTNRYDDMATMLQMPEGQEEEVAEYYIKADENKLLEVADGLFQFFTQDEFAVLFRKLLVSEQYKSDLASQYFEHNCFVHGTKQFLIWCNLPVKRFHLSFGNLYNFCFFMPVEGIRMYKIRDFSMIDDVRKVILLQEILIYLWLSGSLLKRQRGLKLQER